MIYWCLHIFIFSEKIYKKLFTFSTHPLNPLNTPTWGEIFTFSLSTPPIYNGVSKFNPLFAVRPDCSLLVAMSLPTRRDTFLKSLLATINNHSPGTIILLLRIVFTPEIIPNVHNLWYLLEDFWRNGIIYNDSKYIKIKLILNSTF